MTKLSVTRAAAASTATPMLSSPSTEPARLALLEEHRRHVLHDLEHLNDCPGAINSKIDMYRGRIT